MLVQQIQPQLIRPPITIGSADAGGVVEGAFAFFTHLSLSLEGIYIADNLVWEDFHCAVWGHGRGPSAVERVLINNSFIFNLLRYCAVNGLRKDESRPSSLTIYLRSARLPLASGAVATCDALPGASG